MVFLVGAGMTRRAGTTPGVLPDRVYANILELVMRTTISIDEQLIDELMRAEPKVSRSEALRRAVQSHLQRKRVDAFMALAGSRLVDLDWREMERVEMQRADRPARVTHGRTPSRPR
ncbi:MAG: type II toxin-antitoxin system VapB family antitoxin [Acidobacteria bacterium]|nr:type II toxin-antitoxin system VapB family antitoxin [Acidobacteriota bacterium]